jgi:hypothetical protein
MVTTSLGLGSRSDELWTLPQIDFAQMHLYVHQPEYIDYEREQDTARYVLEMVPRLLRYEKPFLLAEFGYSGSEDFNPMNTLDAGGIHLHNAIWASGLSGAAGTIMLWWWDTYIHPKDLYYHYEAFARFAQDVDWAAAPWTRLSDDGETAVRIIGLQRPGEALLWIQHRNNTWYRQLIQSVRPRLLRDVRVQVPALKDGTYRVEWWDTYLAGIITHLDVQVEDGLLKLTVPDAGPDVACKVRWLKE